MPGPLSRRPAGRRAGRRDALPATGLTAALAALPGASAALVAALVAGLVAASGVLVAALPASPAGAAAGPFEGWPGAGLGVLALTAVVLAAVLAAPACLVGPDAPARVTVPAPARAAGERPRRQWDPDAAGRPRPRAPGGQAHPSA